MTLLEKIKINIDYLLGKADPSLYPPRKIARISHKDWQKRLEIFGYNNECFIWFGVDSKGSIAEFTSGTLSYVPEDFFQDVSANKKRLDFFWDLPEITTSLLPDNLDPELKKFANDKSYTFWKVGANDGLFKFEETGNNEWHKTFAYSYEKPPYELMLIPKEPLKFNQLPEEIQTILKPYHFENLDFEDCRFLDVSKYFYCEE